MRFKRPTTKQLSALFWLFVVTFGYPAQADIVCRSTFEAIGLNNTEKYFYGASKMSSGPRRFHQEIVDSYVLMDRISKRADEILSIDANKLGDGAFSSAVVKVQTAEGVKALKIFQDSSITSFTVSFAIQNALAQRGYAPKVEGVLSQVEVNKLVKKHPILKILLEGHEPGFALLMEFVDSSVENNINRLPFPIDYSKQVAEIEKIMSDLQIVPGQDLQFAITRTGRFLLFDFDGYYYLGEKGKVYGLETPDGYWSFEKFFFDMEFHTSYYHIGYEHMDMFNISMTGKYSVRLNRLRRQLRLNSK